MNSKNITPIPGEKVNHICFKCLKEGKVHKIKLGPLGYGSKFDCSETKIHLCDSCFNASKNIWTRKISVSGQYPLRKEKYTNEDEIWEYISTLPVEGRELVENSLWEDDGRTLEPQDYIDYQLGELPHDKCKAYGLVSQEEIKAWEERYPSCKKVCSISFSTEAQIKECPFGASQTNKTACYNCKHYQQGMTQIEELTYDQWSDIKKLVKSHEGLIQSGMSPQEVLKILQAMV